MHEKYAPLFQPLTFNNGVTARNRLAVAPMTHYCSHSDGTISDAERRFLQGRAQDMGLFITAATLVSPCGKAFDGQPEAIDEHHLPSLRETARIIQAQGALAIAQLHHGGRLADATLTGGVLLAPADDPKTGARALTAAEIEALVQSFARAAELVLLAGFDGVEIHGANGYLVQQFVSARTNIRTDEWGGSPEKRLRFSLALVDAIEAVRQRHARPDFVMGYRFSPEEPGDRGLTMADTFALLDALKTRPLQYLHVSLWDFHKLARRGADTSLTRMQLLHDHLAGALPLIGVGHLLDGPAIARAAATGWAEMLALGRAVMLNPDMATLLKQGRDEAIITALDPQRSDRYGLPDALWDKCLQGAAWLPHVLGREPINLDI